MEKLTLATFPAATSPHPPAWLGWTSTEWQAVRTTWFAQVGAVLDTEVHLKTYFLADQRVGQAEMERDAEPSNAETFAPDAWYDRDLRWRDNMRRDLIADVVPAPGRPGQWWMLNLPDMSME